MSMKIWQGYENFYGTDQRIVILRKNSVILRIPLQIQQRKA